MGSGASKKQSVRKEDPKPQSHVRTVARAPTTSHQYMAATTVGGLSLISSRKNKEVDSVSIVSAPADPNLVQCSYCCRSFSKDRIGKHEDVCDKGNSKKRRQFDPIKMRVQGTESEKFIRKIKDNVNAPSMVPKQDWRREHEEFVQTIRAAKTAQEHLDAGGRVQDLPPPPPSDTSHYVPCPHCGRRFNAAVAERHVPKCAAIVSNKPAAVKGARRR